VVAGTLEDVARNRIAERPERLRGRRREARRLELEDEVLSGPVHESDRADLPSFVAMERGKGGVVAGVDLLDRDHRQES